MGRKRDVEIKNKKKSHKPEKHQKDPLSLKNSRIKGTKLSNHFNYKIEMLHIICE
jgi:hypothetical protein